MWWGFIAMLPSDFSTNCGRKSALKRSKIEASSFVVKASSMKATLVRLEREKEVEERGGKGPVFSILKRGGKGGHASH
jgi:hypothetical protein